MATFHASAEHAGALSRLGILDYATAMAHEGGAARSVHAGRSVVEIAEGLFLKRCEGGLRETRLEVRAMSRLAAGAGPSPVPVVAAGEGSAGGFLITARPKGAVPLEDALFECRGPERRRLLRALGTQVRELHDRGLRFPDLMAHHVLVGPGSHVWLIDVGRLTRRGGGRARARDLAALELSLPFGAAGPADRARFLTAYLGRRPRSGEPLLRLAQRAYRRLDRRSRHRVDRLVASPEELEFLARHGIESFRDLMEYRGSGAECLRRLPDRENWRIDLGGRVFYVKRHRPVRGLGRTPASMEWEAIHHFRHAGIRAMRPVAFGEDVRAGSTIWVERAEGRPLDDLLGSGAVGDGLRRELVLETAAILRAMRRREMHHRDMYACHLIADPSAPVGERLTVIDLQRARRKRGLRSRWYVKDLAQLLHSAPRPPVTGADLARFLRFYSGARKLGPAEKRLARRVSRKARGIG